MQQVNEFESAIHQQRRQTTESGTVMANKLCICSESEADCEFEHGGIRCNRRRSIGGSSTQLPSLLLLPVTTTTRAVASVSTDVPSSPADIRKTGCTGTSKHTKTNTTTTTHHDDGGDDDDDEEQRKELLLLLEQQNLMRNDYFNVSAAFNCHGSNSGISSHCLSFDGVRGPTKNITTNVSPVPQALIYDDLSAVAGKCSHQQTGCWWFADFGRHRSGTTKNCNCEYHRIIKRSSNTATTFGERLIVATDSWKTIQNININNAGYAVAYENQEAVHGRQHHQRDDSLGENTLNLSIY